MRRMRMRSGVPLYLSLLLAVFPALLNATFFGAGQYGQSLGCSWGTKPVAVPGQCGTFHCLSQFFLSSSYMAQCPYGTMFSISNGHCISPLALATRCAAASVHAPHLWSWY